MTVYVARQPIFNRKEETVAYELLYRNQKGQVLANVTDGDTATMELLKNSLLNIGIDRLSEGKMLFINFTENLLLIDPPAFLERDKIVIEILEDVESSERLIQSCRKLRKKGYTLALDDYVLHERNKELVPLANIIKVDFLQTPRFERQRMMKELKQYNLLWLAEKVETREQLQQAMEEGFSLFQGFFFAKPALLSADSIPEFSNNYLVILNEVAAPLPSIQNIARLIEGDLSLSYQLLKLLNKTAFIQREKVKTIHQAIMLIGLEELKKWILFIMINTNKQTCSEEIMRTSLVRAKTLEQLARNYFPDQPTSQLFLLGMLSMIDALLGKPMESILPELPIDTEIKEALLLKENHFSKALLLIRSLEEANWPSASDFCSQLQIEEDILFTSYNQAIRWSDQLLQKNTELK
ncbi:EAL and HDOD domain-containing protein [Bacillus sp. FJAT-52991]|uniref:HDOD domain-containing protein n=1 Tax=Bacillus kandeliae TaxID=3129297 RepID=A0ABZ2NAK4_9BACI